MFTCGTVFLSVYWTEIYSNRKNDCTKHHDLENIIQKKKKARNNFSHALEDMPYKGISPLLNLLYLIYLSCHGFHGTYPSGYLFIRTGLSCPTIDPSR